MWFVHIVWGEDRSVGAKKCPLLDTVSEVVVDSLRGGHYPCVQGSWTFGQTFLEKVSKFGVRVFVLRVLPDSTLNFSDCGNISIDVVRSASPARLQNIRASCVAAEKRSQPFWLLPWVGTPGWLLCTCGSASRTAFAALSLLSAILLPGLSNFHSDTPSFSFSARHVLICCSQMGRVCRTGLFISHSGGDVVGSHC